MGLIIKKIKGDVELDPDYNEFTLEVIESVKHRKLHGIRNYPGVVHLHSKNMRLDLKWEDYKVFRDAFIDAYNDLAGVKGWKPQ